MGARPDSTEPDDEARLVLHGQSAARRGRGKRPGSPVRERHCAHEGWSQSLPEGVLPAASVSSARARRPRRGNRDQILVIVAPGPVFRAVKLAGAAYLIWLGVQSLRTAVRPNRPGPSVERATGPLPTRAAFVQGIVNNLGNPKMAVFFASMLPQFTAPGQGMGAALVLLGVVFFRSGPGRTRRQCGRGRSMSAG
jgi:hypothetical protein